MKRFFHLAFVGALVAGLVVSSTACHSARRGEALGRPLKDTSPAVERGHIVFQKHCYRCHPNGEGGLGPSLSDKPLFVIKTQVRAGLGAMPGFRKEQISPEELDDLMKYMVALRKAD
jgi:mono/diheme cytochrome c family protein